MPQVEVLLWLLLEAVPNKQLQQCVYPRSKTLTHVAACCCACVLCEQVNEQFTTYTATDVAEGLQDFLICIEMFVAALAHTYAFPPRVSLQGVWHLTAEAGDTVVDVWGCLC